MFNKIVFSVFFFVTNYKFFIYFKRFLTIFRSFQNILNDFLTIFKKIQKNIKKKKFKISERVTSIKYFPKGCDTITDKHHKSISIKNHKIIIKCKKEKLMTNNECETYDIHFQEALRRTRTHNNYAYKCLYPKI